MITGVVRGAVHLNPRFRSTTSVLKAYAKDAMSVIQRATSVSRLLEPASAERVNHPTTRRPETCKGGCMNTLPRLESSGCGRGNPKA